MAVGPRWWPGMVKAGRREWPSPARDRPDRPWLDRMPMQPWFRDAKLGIFVHWGVYAVDRVPESWSFYTGQVSHEQYMKQLDGFTASRRVITTVWPCGTAPTAI